MLDLLWKRHSQAGLRMLFHNTPPLGDQAQTGVFSERFLGEASQGHLRSKMLDGVSEPHASSLTKGFEAQHQFGLPKHSPAFLRTFVKVRAFCGSKNDLAYPLPCHSSPSLSLVTPEPRSTQ